MPPVKCYRLINWRISPFPQLPLMATQKVIFTEKMLRETLKNPSIEQKKKVVLINCYHLTSRKHHLERAGTARDFSVMGTDLKKKNGSSFYCLKMKPKNFSAGHLTRTQKTTGPCTSEKSVTKSPGMDCQTQL